MTNPKPTTQTTDRTGDESSPLGPLSRRQLLQTGAALSAAMAAGSGTALAQQSGNTTPDENLVWEEVATPDNPAGIDFDSEGRIWVVNRDGHVDVVDPETGDSNTALNLNVYTAGEHGAVGIAVDPDFQQNNWIYVFYAPAASEVDQSFSNGTYNQVSRFTVDGDTADPNSETEIIRIPSQRELPVHIGGGLDFGPNRTLHIGLGDNTHAMSNHVSHWLLEPGTGSFIFPDAVSEPADENTGDSRGTALDTSDLRGSILRIIPEEDGSYSIPEGNLFPEDEYASEIQAGTVRPEIFAMGFRNPFKIHADDETGWVFGAGQATQASGWDANSGPPGLGPVFRFREAGNLGWPMFRGIHPYMRPSSSEDVVSEYSHLAGQLYDTSAPINASPRNDGLRELPPIDEDATVVFAPAEGTESQYLSGPSSGPWDVPSELPYPELTDYSPICGTLIRTDDTAVGGLPDDYDGSLIFGMWNNGDLYRLGFDENGDMTELESFLPNLPNASFTDAAMGPDNCLYLCDWGSNDFQPSNGTIYRIDYDSDAELEIEEEFALEGEVSGWTGVSPSAIAGEANPTLDLEPGLAYRIEWTNGDGIAHNFAIRNEDEEVLRSTALVSTQGETQTLEFVATEEMDHYVCEPHPSSMRGGIGDDSAPEDPEPEDNLGDPREHVTVSMTGSSQFAPRIAHVVPGGTVTWEFEGGQPHNTVAYHPDTNGDQQRIPEAAEPWQSSLLSGSGDTYERTFEEPGVYDYVCTPHEAGGMVGSVVVGWPDPADEPGLEPPADEISSSARSVLESDNEQIRAVLEDGQSIELGEYEPAPYEGSDLYYDVDGSGSLGSNDVVAFFENFEEAAAQNNPQFFDYNSSGRVGFDDVVALFNSI